MAKTISDSFAARARRAYELGRIRLALAGSWRAAALAAISVGVCHEAGRSAAIGTVLIALTAVLIWYGRFATRAVNAGLLAGLAAFALPVASFQLNLCPNDAQMLLINGLSGVAVGLLLSVASTRQVEHRDLFLLFSTMVAALCGTLGCLLFGVAGVVGMVAGSFLATAPVAVYYRVTA
jgi:hypothetical protein